MASSFAPILVFVHTREKHFKNLINSLLTCKESESTNFSYHQIPTEMIMKKGV